MPNNNLPFVDDLEQYELEPSFKNGFILDGIIVIPEKRVLIINHVHHHISAKATELLCILATYDHAIVSRDALIKHLWDGEEHNPSILSSLVSEVRRAIDDHADNPQFIQTFPKKGYYLIANTSPLEENLLSAEELMAATGENHNNQRRLFLGFIDIDYIRKSSLFKVAGTYIVMSWVLMQVVSVSVPTLDLVEWFDKLTLLLLVIGFPVVLWYNWWTEYKIRKRFADSRNKEWANKYLSTYLYRDVSYISILTLSSVVISIFVGNQLVEEAMAEPTQIVQENTEIKAQMYPNAIAIMPFRQTGDVADFDFVNLLQTEMLIFLSQQSSLRVISERVLSSIPNNAPISAIRELSGAKYILEGSIRETLQQPTLLISLVDSQTGHQVWANRVSLDERDALDIFETLAKQVYNAVTFLMPDDAGNPVFKPTENIDAYDAYIRAKATLKNAYNFERLKEAENLFLSALGSDSKFVQAQVGLCQTYLEQYSLSNVSQTFDMARQTCNFEGISKSHAASQVALGKLYVISGDYENGLVHLDEALNIEPDNSVALTEKAKVVSILGDADEAENLFLQAIKAEPGYWRNYERYGVYLFSTGQYYGASLQFEKQVLLQPESEEALNNLGAAYFLSSNYEQATISWQRALKLNPSANAYSNVGTSLFLEQRFSEAVDMYKEAVKLSPSSYILRGNLADAMKFAGDMSKQSEQAYKEALSLARDSEAINPNDITTKTSIARYLAELNQCKVAKQLTDIVTSTNPEDPYIYYDLALISINCASAKDVLANLQRALALGYSTNLLLTDHQFEAYHQKIAAIQL